MTHEERLQIVTKLVQGDTTPPTKFYERNVWGKGSEEAILNLYDWYSEKGLVEQNGSV